MARPQQSASSEPVLPSRPRRRFTLEQANKALPLVRRVVTDIVATRQLAADLQSMIESTPDDQRKAIQTELDSAIDKLHAYLDELTEIGVELKDFQLGLIDFVGRHQGRDVYLCWKLGEERVGHFHELNAGFGGRLPVSLLEENA